MTDDTPNVTQLGPRELAELLARPDAIQLVDVREPWEWQLCRIPGAVHLPLSQFGARFDELDRGRDVVIYCHHGIRSQMAAEFLTRQGFPRVGNLAGGIDAWSILVDPNTPRY